MKKVKAWAIIDKNTGIMIPYNSGFQSVYHIHTTKRKANNAKRVANFGKRLKVLPCEIHYHLSK